MDKEIKINVPEGYEIDKENSTFECIKFKKKENYSPNHGDFIVIKSRNGFTYHCVFDKYEADDKSQEPLLYGLVVPIGERSKSGFTCGPVVFSKGVETIRGVNTDECNKMREMLDKNGYTLLEGTMVSKTEKQDSNICDGALKYKYIGSTPLKNYFIGENKENGKYCIVGPGYEPVPNTTFDTISVFNEYGYAFVWKDFDGVKKENLIDGSFRTLLEEWVDCVHFQHMDRGGYKIIVVNNMKYNFITKSFKLADDVWFDDYGSTRCDMTIVFRGGKFNFIKIDGTLYSKTWFVDKKKIDNTGFLQLRDENGRNYVMNEWRQILKEPVELL